MRNVVVFLCPLGLILSGCSGDPRLKPYSNSSSLLGNEIQRGSDGENGANCWEGNFVDSDGDGLPNPEFDADDDGFPEADINKDGVLSAVDCLGAQGAQGLQGDPGDDGTNGANGQNGADGTNGAPGANCYDGMTDQNGDGVVNRLDCRGAAGSNGTNGMAGQNGRNGANCFDWITDPFTQGNRDGVADMADCQGPTTTPNFNAFVVIKCRAGSDVPGGVDSSGLMNEHFEAGASGGQISSTAQCPQGTRLIMSTVTSVKVTGSPGDQTNNPYVDYGVAAGRMTINDLYPTKIECFYQNRFDGGSAGGGSYAVTGMGLCAPIPQ